MRITSPLSSFPLRRPPSPGLPAFEALLDYLGLPALVVEAETGRILLANGPLSELTAYTRIEMSSMDLRILLAGLDKELLISALGGEFDPLDLDLKKRSGQFVTVQVSTFNLDVQKKWILLALEPVVNREQRAAEQQRQDTVWESLQMLARLPQQSDMAEVLEKAIEAGSKLIGASILAIYLGEGKDYILTCRASMGGEAILPEQVHPQDMISLQSPHVWMPRRRSYSSLHRSARVADLSYMATVPLGEPNALIGLLVAAHKDLPPPDKLLDLMNIFGCSLTTVFQNQAVNDAIEMNRKIQLTHQAFSSAIKDAVQDGIIYLSPGLHIQELNPSAESILGYASAEVRGQPYQNLLIGAGQITPEFLLHQPGITIHDLGSTKLFRRDGRTFLANLRAAPIIVEGKLENILVFIQDLSQEEQFRIRNQQLEQRAILGEVTAIFAHEVRNPINSISTGLQVLSMNFSDEDPNKEDINRIMQDCERLADLMKSVLSFAKPMEYKIEPVDLGKSITRLLERWRPTMAKSRVQYEVLNEPSTPPVEGDQRALEQVWTNLISNAIQAMNKDGGKLLVKIRPVITPENTTRVEVSISDTGSGIPEEIRDRIFEPFFTTNSSSGTGLGLAITRHIISTHKGSLKVTSVPGGTVFQIQLPVYTAKA